MSHLREILPRSSLEHSGALNSFHGTSKGTEKLIQMGFLGVKIVATEKNDYAKVPSAFGCTVLS